MNTILASGKITLHKEGLFASDIAADGGWLYILDRRWQKVHRFTMSGESSGEYGTARKYTRFCYDKGEHCFWAVAGAAQTVYRLSADFKETGSFVSGIPETLPVESLKYQPERGALLAAFRGAVYELYKIGFSRLLLHSAQPLRLYDRIGDSRVVAFEAGERELLVTDRTFTESGRITLPEGSRCIGETGIYEAEPCLAVLFCKNACNNMVFFIKSEKHGNQEPDNPDIERLRSLLANELSLLPALLKEPSLFPLSTSERKPAAAGKEEPSEPAQEKIEGKNPWGFIGDLLNL